MKLTDVIVLKKLDPITIEVNPSNETYEFLHRLENNSAFIGFIESTRASYNIPKSGYDIHKEVGKNFYDVSENYLLGLKLIAQDFSKSTGDNEEYLLQIVLLLFYNSVIEVKNIKSNEIFPIEFVYGRKRISAKLWDYDKEVGSILIPFNVTKTALKQWIDVNWDKICNEMSDNYTLNPNLQRIHKNIIKEEEIKEYKTLGKTISQIVTLFREKYPNEKWYPSKIKKIYADEKQRIALQKALNDRNNK